MCPRLLNIGLYSLAVDRCPMYFNDGADPWNVEENHIRIFNFDDVSDDASITSVAVALPVGVVLLLKRM